MVTSDLAMLIQDSKSVAAGISGWVSAIEGGRIATSWALDLMFWCSQNMILLKLRHQSGDEIQQISLIGFPSSKVCSSKCKRICRLNNITQSAVLAEDGIWCSHIHCLVCNMYWHKTICAVYTAVHWNSLRYNETFWGALEWLVKYTR